MVAGLAVLVGACGVPLDRDPERIPDQQLPADIGSSPAAPPPTVRSEPAATVEVYFVRGERLAAVRRQISGPATLSGILDQVVAGPAPDEALTGMRSAITPGASVRRAVLSDGLASIDLSEPFGDVQGRDQITAVAQIVFSCTAVPGVERVQFQLEGRPVEVPTGDGTLTTRPLTRADFVVMAPP